MSKWLKTLFALLSQATFWATDKQWQMCKHLIISTRDIRLEIYKKDYIENIIMFL